MIFCLYLMLSPFMFRAIKYVSNPFMRIIGGKSFKSTQMELFNIIIWLRSYCSMMGTNIIFVYPHFEELIKNIGKTNRCLQCIIQNHKSAGDMAKIEISNYFKLLKVCEKSKSGNLLHGFETYYFNENDFRKSSLSFSDSNIHCEQIPSSKHNSTGFLSSLNSIIDIRFQQFEQIFG